MEYKFSYLFIITDESIIIISILDRIHVEL